MYINNVEEYNETSLSIIGEVDLKILKKANIQIDNFISPHAINNPFAKAYQKKTSVIANVSGLKVILDTEYQKGLFDFTTVIIQGLEYDVQNCTVESAKTVLNLYKSPGTFTDEPVLIYQRWQSPFLIDTREIDLKLNKYIRQDIKEAVALQYDYLLKNKTSGQFVKNSESLNNANYSVGYNTNISLDRNTLVSPEAKIILEKYKPYI